MQKGTRVPSSGTRRPVHKAVWAFWCSTDDSGRIALNTMWDLCLKLSSPSTSYMGWPKPGPGLFLFPRRDTSLFLKGVLSERHIEAQLEALRTMDVDQYIERTVKPVEETIIPGACEIIAQFNRRIVREIEDGPCTRPKSNSTLGVN